MKSYYTFASDKNDIDSKSTSLDTAATNLANAKTAYDAANQGANASLITSETSNLLSKVSSMNTAKANLSASLAAYIATAGGRDAAATAAAAKIGVYEASGGAADSWHYKTADNIGASGITAEPYTAADDELAKDILSLIARANVLAGGASPKYGVLAACAACPACPACPTAESDGLNWWWILIATFVLYLLFMKKNRR